MGFRSDFKAVGSADGATPFSSFDMMKSRGLESADCNVEWR